MYQAKIWCQKIFPLLGGGGFLDKIFFFQSEHVSSQIWCQKIFPFTETGIPPPPVPGWISLPKNLRPETPPPHPRLDQPIQKSETWDPPPNVNRQTPVKTVPSRRTLYAGGNYLQFLMCLFHFPEEYLLDLLLQHTSPWLDFHFQFALRL